MWLFSALESSGFNSSKLHRSSADTDMTAPQLSNSPQYCLVSFKSSEREGLSYVGCRENCHQNLVVEELVAVLHHHVRAAYQVEVVHSEEVRDDALTEAVAYAAFVRLPVLFHVRRV